jgi:seryl-tRNA synthetase
MSNTDYENMKISELENLRNNLSEMLETRRQKEQEEQDNIKREGAEKLANAVQRANDALQEATNIADKYGLSFNFGPAYGMGGTYYGRENADYDESDYYDSDEQGWVSSSEQC